MKKVFIKYRTVYSIAVILIGLVSFGLTMQSCSDETYFDDSLDKVEYGEFEYLGKKIKYDKSNALWQEQLNLLINNNNRIKNSGLELHDYIFVRKIDIIEEIENIKSEILDDNSLIAWCDTVSNRLELYPLYKIDKDKTLKQILDRLISPSKHSSEIDNSNSFISVYEFEENDMGIVNLEWIYKGNKYNTICLVSDKKGVIYDNFL